MGCSFIGNSHQGGPFRDLLAIDDTAIVGQVHPKPKILRVASAGNIGSADCLFSAWNMGIQSFGNMVTRHDN